MSAEDPDDKRPIGDDGELGKVCIGSSEANAQNNCTKDEKLTTEGNI